MLLAALALAGWTLVVWSVLSRGAPWVALTMPMRVAWTLPEAVAVWLMWAVMMGAMMLPSATPVVVLHRRLSAARHGSAEMEGRHFVAGYLAAWSLFSLAAAGTQWLLQLMGVLSPMLVVTHSPLAALMLMGAGVYQFTPAKNACLKVCRTPIGFFVTGWRPGRWGALRMGLEHGAYCIGCCWALMAMLFVFGVMSLASILVLATAVAAEKLLPWGARIGQLLGVVLVGWGLYLLFT
jgi:predicted metal-binding membrane protein